MADEAVMLEKEYGLDDLEMGKQDEKQVGCSSMTCTGVHVPPEPASAADSWRARQ